MNNIRTINKAYCITDHSVWDIVEYEKSNVKETSPLREQTTADSWFRGEKDYAEKRTIIVLKR